VKTIKLNVYEEQRKWERWHRAAGATIVFNVRAEVVAAHYKSPLEQWRDLMRPDGTVDVPDMDYYNSLTGPEAISAAVDELFAYTQDEPTLWEPDL
jgi:hypothetical protein